ncbi:MAG: autotransporter-associated beta strand repeat-containing protein [Planctomycetota bacterium]
MANAQVLIDYDDGIANGVHDASINNGGFEDVLVTAGAAGDRLDFAETPSWTNVAPGGDQTLDFVRTNLEATSDQNAVIADAAFRPAGVDVGHTLSLGDAFDFSYVWRDASLWNAADRVAFTFFTTTDDTLTGDVLNAYPVLSGVSTTVGAYQPADGSFLSTNPADAGKSLFVSIGGVDGGGGANGFARIDDVSLEVVAPPVGVAYWTGGPAGSWNTGANWSTSPAVPNSSAADVLFAFAAEPTAVNVASSVTVNSLQFAGDTPFTLTASAGRTVTLADSFGGAGDAQIDAAGGLHDVAASLAGATGFEKTGLGSVRLSGSSPGFSGAVAISEGDLFVSNTNGLGAASVSIANGSFLYLEAGYTGSFANSVSGDGELRLGENATTEVITIDGNLSALNGPISVRGGVSVFNSGNDFGTPGDGNRQRTYVNLPTGQLQFSNAGTVAESFSIGSRAGVDEAHLSAVSGVTTVTGDVEGINGGANHIISAAAGATVTFNNTDADPSTLTSGNDGTFVFQGEGNIVIGDAGGSGVATGQLIGPASVIKQGAGTLTIATRGDNSQSWSGTTVVEAGTLEVLAGAGSSGELASPSIQVRSGAVLDVESFAVYSLQIDQAFGGGGQVRATSLALFDDSVVTPGDSVGTLTIDGNATINSFSSATQGAFVFELGDTAATVGGGENDLIAVTGSVEVNLGGGAGTMPLSIVPVEGILQSGSYTLFTAGSVSGSAAGLFSSPAITDADGNALNTRQTVSVSNTATTIVATVAGSQEARTWRGDGATPGDGVWDVASSTHWNEGDQQYRELDDVTFGAVAGGDGTNEVTITGPTESAAVTPGSVAIAGGDDYVFTGDGIQGAAGIVKTGAGTATLANSGNRFTGGIDIQQGTLTLDGSNTSFTGAVNIANGATLNIGGLGGDNGANAFTNATVGGVTIATNATGVINVLSDETIYSVTGGGAINAVEATTALQDNADFTGQINVSSGATVEVFNASGLGDTSSGTVIADGGRLFVDATAAEDINTTEAITVGGLGGDNAPDGPGAIQVGGVSEHTFAGPITLTSETEFRTGANTAVMNVTGSVNGSAANAGLRLSSVGAINVSAPVSLGSGSVTKSSSGTATLSGTVAYSGDTVVSGGTLALTGSASLGASRSISVGSGGTLDATGIGGLTVADTTIEVGIGGAVRGDVDASSGSSVTGGGAFADNLSIAASTVTLGVNPPPNSTVNENLFYDGGQVASAPSFDYTASITDQTTGVSFDVVVTITPSAGGELRTNGGTGDREWGVRTAGDNAAISTTGESITASLTSLTVTDFGGFAEEDVQVNFDGFTDAVLYFVGNGSDAGKLTDGVTDLWAFQGTLDPTENGGTPDITLGDLPLEFGVAGEGAGPGGNARIDLSSLLPTTLVAEAVDHTNPPPPVGSAGEDNNRFRIDDYGVQFTIDVTSPSAETLTVEGDYTQDAGSVLAVEIASETVAGLLSVDGVADLAGLVAPSFPEGFLPATNDSWTIVTAGASLDTTGLSTLDGFSLSAVGNDLVLTFVGSALLPGDFNNDGIVDTADYTVWRDSLGNQPGALGANDTVGGVIGIAQYELWKTNFGAALPAALRDSASVPEPTAAWLVASVGAGLAAHRRRRPSCRD